MHVTPTPGRIVWFRAGDDKIRAAIVTAAHGPFSVNLHVFGLHASDPCSGPRDTVTHADPEQEPGCTPSWHWMPYQKEQAAKASQPTTEHPSYNVEQLRGAALEASLRTYGHVGCHKQVLEGTAAYMAFLQHGTLPAEEPKE